MTAVPQLGHVSLIGFGAALFRIQILWTCIAAALGSAIFTAILIKIAGHRGWVVIPQQDRWNKRVVAQFGGVPILLAFSFSALLLPFTSHSLSLIVATLGIAVLGLVDDIVGLGPAPKLMVESSVACLMVYAGIVCPLTGSSLINGALSVLWMVGITNAFNLIDNMDGLAGGVAVITLFEIIVFAGWNTPLANLALCMLVSTFGFLVFNVSPARIFMGDVGALPLGFFLACSSLLILPHRPGFSSVLLLPGLVLFVPVFDTLLVSVTRWLHGSRISAGGCDHSSHRLVLLGFTERRAVALLHGVALLAGVVAVLSRTLQPWIAIGLIVVFLLASALFWLKLARLQLPEGWHSPFKARPFPQWLPWPKFVSARNTQSTECVLNQEVEN
jgi:UDP-GlcNAc:undecaprenyl-phosphate/decaprenyl-phosphate GlcNAc-1-phosphate transferase